MFGIYILPNVFLKIGIPKMKNSGIFVSKALIVGDNLMEEMVVQCEISHSCQQPAIACQKIKI